MHPTSNRGSEEAPEISSPDGRFVRLEELSRNASKVIYKGIDRQVGINVAWNEVVLDNSLNPAKLKRQLQILKELDHENIIVVYDSWMEPDYRKCVFITQLMGSGTLKSFLKLAGSVSKRVVKDWCKQILSGLSYLHDRSIPIIHREIRLDNIFFSGARGKVKIGDLGFATIMESSGGENTLSMKGTPQYMAPEVFEDDYNELADIWAFGMCVLEIVTNEFPYSECQTVGQLYRKVMAGEVPRCLFKIIDTDVLTLILWCLEPQENRQSAKELLEHPFIVESKESDSEPVQLRSEEETNSLYEHYSSKYNEYVSMFIDTPAERKIHNEQKKQTGVRVRSSSMRLPKNKLTINMNDESSDDKLIASPDFISSPPNNNIQHKHEYIIEEKQQKQQNVTPSGQEILHRDSYGTFNHKVDNQSDNNIQIALNLVISGLNFNQNVSFAYDAKSDTPESVAQELVAHFRLPTQYTESIANYIRRHVEVSSSSTN